MDTLVSIVKATRRRREGWKTKFVQSWRHLEMPEPNFKNTAQSVIPDDPEASAYRFIIVAAKRARQLQNGARSFLPTTSKKPTVVAMEEVRRGLVQYEDPAFQKTQEKQPPQRR